MNRAEGYKIGAKSTFISLDLQGRRHALPIGPPLIQELVADLVGFGVRTFSTEDPRIPWG